MLFVSAVYSPRGTPFSPGNRDPDDRQAVQQQSGTRDDVAVGRLLRRQRRIVQRRIERRDPVLALVHRRHVLVADAVVDGQIRARLPVILHVELELVVAQIPERRGVALRVGVVAADQQIRERDAGRSRLRVGERERPGIWSPQLFRLAEVSE